jgi:hypothetical protein
MLFGDIDCCLFHYHYEMMHWWLSIKLLDPLSGLDCLSSLSFWLLLYPHIVYPFILCV